MYEYKTRQSIIREANKKTLCTEYMGLLLIAPRSPVTLEIFEQTENTQDEMEETSKHPEGSNTRRKPTEVKEAAPCRKEQKSVKQDK